jgi:hypothetical protein
MAERDIIMISRRELKRLQAIRKVIEKKIKQVEVAEVLELSARQIGRLVKRVKEEGNSGIGHRLRGKSSNRLIDEGFKTEVVDLYRDKYKGFGPTLFCEKLLELEKIQLSDETVRKLLLGSGDWQKRRKGRKHRQWRERRSHYGQMEQMDGSHHDGLEGRGSWLVLMAYIDDATGRVYGRFYDYEGTIPAMDSFKRYIGKYGLPQSVYLDKHTTYKSTAKLSIEDELNGREPLSQFGRALKELGVKVIHAHSPQAKGRVERLFETLQDRLVKEMRLRGIKTKEEANEFLEEYLPKLDEKFGVIAKEQEDLHFKLPRGINLERILCIKDERVLRNDFTVVKDNRLYQVLDNIKADKVTLEERIDGSLRIYSGNKLLRYKHIETLPGRQRKVLKKLKAVLSDKAGKQWIPPKNHPWRRSYKTVYAQ